MKTRETAKKAAYIGAGAGLVLFAVMGLLPGSFLGGAIGLNIAKGLFGMPLASSLVSRLIVGISMLMGVLVAGTVCIASMTTVGWFTGQMVATVRAGKTAMKEIKVLEAKK